MKTQRTVLRKAFTLAVKKIETEMSSEVVDLKNIALLQIQLDDKFSCLEKCQESISENILLGDDSEDQKQFAEDFEGAEKYREQWLEATSKASRYLKDAAIPLDAEKPRKFKLPEIELKKFSGEAKEYLSFWSQFQKIHEDRSIPAEDKMQYLIQAMEPQSKAERLVLSFPATAANYPKAIEQLRDRFGRSDLLVQIYVRELLAMVMKNAISGRVKTDLPRLYDELEGKLRALESLGTTQEKFGDFLTPLVESCLPEEILMAWERSRNHIL